MTDFPVLRIRATDRDDVAEISLGGIDLLPLGIHSLSLNMTGPTQPVVTLTFEVTPDFELPTEVEAWLSQRDASGSRLSRVQPKDAA